MMLSRKLSVLEIPLDKELTANCLAETYETQGADPGCDGSIWSEYRVQLPLWLKQSLINGFSWYGLYWATVVSEHL